MLFNLVGRLCELRESAAARNARERCRDLGVYLNELSTPECAEGEPGTITWTPNDNTPDLLYYQVKIIGPVKGGSINSERGGEDMSRPGCPLLGGLILLLLIFLERL